MAAPAAAATGPPAAQAPDKPTKAAADVWSQQNEEKLIESWGAEFIRIKQGNMAKHHWEKVTKEVNDELKKAKVPFTMQQIKTKIDTLKKRYTIELNKKTGTGSVNSTWAHFDTLGPYLKKLPKVAGIPGACDSGVSNIPDPQKDSEEEEAHEEDARNATPLDAQEEDPFSDSKSANKEEATPVTPKSELHKGKRKESDAADSCAEISPLEGFEKKPGIIGQLNRNGKNKKTKQSPGSAALARSIDNFTKVYSTVAMKAMEVEQAIAKNKLDTNIQLADMQMRYKTELEKMRRGASNEGKEASALLKS